MDLSSHEGLRTSIEATWLRARAVLAGAGTKEFFQEALVRLQVFYSELLDLQERHPVPPLAEGREPESPRPERAQAVSKGAKEAPETPRSEGKAKKKKEKSARKKTPAEEEKVLPRIKTPERRSRPSKAHKEKEKRASKERKSRSRRRERERRSSKEEERSPSLRSATPLVTPVATEAPAEEPEEADFGGNSRSEEERTPEEKEAPRGRGVRLKSPVTPEEEKKRRQERPRDSRSRSRRSWSEEPRSSARPSGSWAPPLPPGSPPRKEPRPPDRPPGRFVAPARRSQDWGYQGQWKKSRGVKARARNLDIELYGPDQARKAERIERYRK